MNLRVLRLIALCLLISLIAVAANQRSSPPQKEPAVGNKAQIHNGLEITILSLQRTKEREVMPHFPQKMRARSGDEFALLTLKVKRLDSEKKLDVGLLELFDVNGRSYKCLFKETDLCDPRIGNEITCELPFAIPEGIELIKLQIGEASFDLKTLERK